MLRGYGSNRRPTDQHASGLGAEVRKGETGTPIVFFKMHELEPAGSALRHRTHIPHIEFVNRTEFPSHGGGWRQVSST